MEQQQRTTAGGSPGGFVLEERTVRSKQPMTRFRAILFLLTAAVALGAKTRDEDRDGVADKLEQSLFSRFAPEFVLSDAECDGLPAELARGTRDPVVASRNGTVYGQAFALPKGDRPGAFLELHYFHLWGRDCGRAGHALDVEHVSVLLEAPRADAPARQWRARYWYAAGHEGTVCDRSTGARAELIRAVDRGARIWVAAGKHASYLDPAWCSWGCGADRCAAATAAAWRPRRIVNLGERGAPMNGATWIESPRWGLRGKLASDFRPELISAMDKSSRPFLLWPELRPAQGFLMAGSEVGAALLESGRRTSAALGLANSATGEAVGASMDRTGRALKRSAQGVARFLGHRPPGGARR